MVAAGGIGIGIGLAIALAFVREGARVAVCDVDAAALAALTSSDPTLHGRPCDGSQREQVAQWCAPSMGANLWAASPLWEYRLGLIVSRTSTSRRQGQPRDGLSGGSLSAKLRGELAHGSNGPPVRALQVAPRQWPGPSPGTNSPLDCWCQGSAYGKCGACVPIDRASTCSATRPMRSAAPRWPPPGTPASRWQQGRRQGWRQPDATAAQADGRGAPRAAFKPARRQDALMSTPGARSGGQGSRSAGDHPRGRPGPPEAARIIGCQSTALACPPTRMCRPDRRSLFADRCLPPRPRLARARVDGGLAGGWRVIAA